MTQRTPLEFCQWANMILRQAGIGNYDDGQPWLCYGTDDDGNVRLGDYSATVVIDNWYALTADDIRFEATGYLETTK